MLLILFFISCKNDEKILSIEILNNHGDIFFSTKREMVYIREYNFFKDEKIDSIKINLSDSDWKAINESFLKNKIISFSHVNDDIGEKTNSIEVGEKYLITTNDRKLVVNYNYFFNDSKINKNKTKRFKKFMKVCDSIINYKLQKSKIQGIN